MAEAQSHYIESIDETKDMEKPLDMIDVADDDISSDNAATPTPQQLTTNEKPLANSPSPGPGPPPNGGLRAWLQVAGSIALYFNTWGLMNSFGVFQTYYESGELFTASSSDIAWIGSLQALILLLTGMFAGPLFDKGYLRSLVVVGTFLVVFGHMMLSLSHTYWEVILCQGLAVGIGAGCLFVPCVAILPQYFSTKLGLAVGLASVGSATGGVIYPIVLYRLIGTIGFPWATRVLGFLALATLTVPLLFSRLRVKPAKARDMIDVSSFTDIPYMAFVLTTMVAFMGLFTLLFYLSFFADDTHITSSEMAFYVVPIYNAGSVFGRALPNAIADKTGPFNLIGPGSLLCGVLVFCLIVAKNTGGIVVLSVLSGFVSGVIIGMPPLCFVALTKDKSKIGTRMGMGYAIIGLGVLAGGPGGGRILGVNSPLDWQGLWIFGGVSCCCAGLGYIMIRIAVYGPKLNVKA